MFTFYRSRLNVRKTPVTLDLLGTDLASLSLEHISYVCSLILLREVMNNPTKYYS